MTSAKQTLSKDPALSIRHLPLPYQAITPYRLLLKNIRVYWYIYLVGMSAVVLTNLTEVLVPKCIQWSIDLLRADPIPELFERESLLASFQAIFTLLVAVYVLQALSRRYWRLTLGRESMHVGAMLRRSLWERARYFRESRLQREFTVGQLMNASVSDVNSARIAFGWTLVGVTDLFFLSFFCIGSMLLIDWHITLLALSLFPPLTFVLQKLRHLEYRYHEQAQESLGGLNEKSSQAVASIKLQKLSATGGYWLDRLTQAAAHYRDRRYKVILVALNFLIVMGILPLCAYLIIFWIGIDRVVAGTLSVGGFIALQSYIFILQGPLAEMGYILAEWQRSIASLTRIVKILKEPPEERLIAAANDKQIDHSAWQEGKELIQVTNLTFSYPDSNVILFNNFSMRLICNQKLGVTGPIGSGKSTLINILAGLERNYRGSVTLINHEITSYAHQALRQVIGVVPQRPFLFADSIFNNIELGRGLTKDQAWHYLEVCALADEINRLPQGIDSPLGEWGINLSGGQKQRLTLARALATRPKLLLLDDCMSAVDAITEDKILRALEKEIKDLTMVWVAHRRSTLRFCDQIVELSL